MWRASCKFELDKYRGTYSNHLTSENALEGRRDGETTGFPLIPGSFLLPLKALAERSGAHVHCVCGARGWGDDGAVLGVSQGRGVLIKRILSYTHSFAPK